MSELYSTWYDSKTAERMYSVNFEPLKEGRLNTVVFSIKDKELLKGTEYKHEELPLPWKSHDTVLYVVSSIQSHKTVPELRTEGLDTGQEMVTRL